MSQWTFHGGRVAEARAFYGGEAWLDLSTGINPDPWPGVASLDIDWQRLPDQTALDELEEAAAAYLSVDPAFVCAVPGTEIGLRLLSDIGVAITAYIAPTYRTHAELVTSRVAIEARALPWPSESLILANPNNPDGRTFGRDLLCGQLAQAARSEHWLVIDEAFADVAPATSLTDQIGDDRRLIIFRSFGKFFGLAGVRLGFVLGPREIISRFRRKLGSWPVTAAALAIGTPAYRDQLWIEATRQRLRQQAKALDAVLHRHGFVPIGDCPLFRLIETPDAAALFDGLARQSILTRPFDDQPHWLRIGLPGSDEALARLDRALAHG
ncbi:threonine-phosphate decarboxylase [Rhizorhabdus argentea]|uniref:threonine-phosphate decarboxylase n=1 Tax=Rhizorhabdus argentea TaxID=1387174 RepID=UPI0030EE3BB2